MLKQFLVAIGILIGLASTPSNAQYAYSCVTYDTTAWSTAFFGAVVLSDCRVNTGPNDVVEVSAMGQISCGPTSDFAGNIFAVTVPFNPGASFDGRTSGNTLTVTNMRTPYPQFFLGAGLTLYDAASGANIPISPPLTITGQSSSAEPDGALGGKGDYTLSASLSVSDETMWALVPNVGTLAGRAAISHGPMEQLACQNGTTQDISLTGRLAKALIPNFSARVYVTMSAEQIGGNPPQSASWKNGEFAIWTIGSRGGGKGQILQ
jgi:hypothetical protein